MKTAYLASILVVLVVAQIIPLPSDEIGSGAYRTITRAKNIVYDTNATIHLYDGKVKAKLSKNDS